MRVGDARVRVDGRRVLIVSEGDGGLDLLRAACAAIWQSGTAIHALAAMIIFGLFTHMACGATYALVPFVNRKALGGVAVRVGGACFELLDAIHAQASALSQRFLRQAGRDAMLSQQRAESCCRLGGHGRRSD